MRLLLRDVREFITKAYVRCSAVRFLGKRGGFACGKWSAECFPPERRNGDGWQRKGEGAYLACI